MINIFRKIVRWNLLWKNGMFKKTRRNKFIKQSNRLQNENVCIIMCTSCNNSQGWCIHYTSYFQTNVPHLHGSPSHCCVCLHYNDRVELFVARSRHRHHSESFELSWVFRFGCRSDALWVAWMSLEVLPASALVLSPTKSNSLHVDALLSPATPASSLQQSAYITMTQWRLHATSFTHTHTHTP